MAVSTEQETQTFIPSIAVNDRGEVAVTYYGFSTRDSDSRALMTDYWIKLSNDQGQSWTTGQKMNHEPFDLRTAPYNAGLFLGEYQGLAGAGQSFVAAATFTNGRDLVNRTDIYSCTVIPVDPKIPLSEGPASETATSSDSPLSWICR